MRWETVSIEIEDRGETQETEGGDRRQRSETGYRE